MDPTVYCSWLNRPVFPSKNHAGNRRTRRTGETRIFAYDLRWILQCPRLSALNCKDPKPSHCLFTFSRRHTLLPLDMPDRQHRCMPAGMGVAGMQILKKAAWRKGWSPRDSSTSRVGRALSKAEGASACSGISICEVCFPDGMVVPECADAEQFLENDLLVPFRPSTGRATPGDIFVDTPSTKCLKPGVSELQLLIFGQESDPSGWTLVPEHPRATADVDS